MARRGDPRRNTLGKLSPPRLGLSFPRERLFERLDACAGQPATWVTGAPGMGKTTLVATYLEARRARCLWLQIDGGDADPAAFAHYLDAAAGHAASRRRRQAPQPTTDDLRDVPGFLRRCFRRLAQALDVPWVLVLDNVQQFGDAPELYAGIATALEELPRDGRVIAISRNLPPPEFARALANQQIVVIDAPALRFTLEETQALVSLHQQACPAAQLQSATDGWAAAMILVLAAGGGLAADMLASGGSARERLFALFAGEVLARLAPRDAAALMRIAFLPSASEAMAKALSGDSRAGALLADLARRSLFTDRREEVEPVYVFHALFGEFLRARAVLAFSPQETRAVRAKAASLLEAAGHADAAIAQCLEVEDWDSAARLIESHAGRLVAQGRTSSVRDWIAALPEQLRSAPQLRYWLGYCDLAVKPHEALRELDLAYKGFTVAADTGGAFLAAAAAADAIVFVGARLDVLAPWLRILATYAPAYLERRDAASDLRVLPGLLAAYVHLDTANPLTAKLAALAEGMLLEPLGASQRILLGTLAYYLLWTGQIARLDHIMVKIDHMCARHDTAPATRLRWYGVGVLIRSLLGRSEEALTDSRRALEVAEGARPLQTKAHLMMVLAALAARNAGLARTHLAAAAGLLDPANAIDATTYEFQRGMLALLERDWNGALRLMREAVESAHASGWPLRVHIALLGRALAATETGQWEEAEEALREAYAHPFYAACRWHHWIAALIEANLAHRRSDGARCVAALRRGFAVGREHGYDFGPLPYCCGDMMPRLVAVALEHEIDVPFAQRVVGRYALAAPQGAGERWPWPIRIRTLGGLRIERDGEPAPAARKESRKPLELLKLMLALGGEAVPVDRLAALLWPDAEGDAARNSFDNAVHRLRKLLGGDVHVRLRTGGLGLNPATCWSDVAALDACLAQAGDSVSDDDVDGQVVLAERALALYRGAFLPGEDDYPELAAARSRIQAQFVRQTGAIGARLELAGRLEDAAGVYARIVEQEPLAEEIYRRLIACLATLGRRAEAFEAYRRCRAQLSILLGVPPSAQTEALAATLRDPNL